jgi:hypothetical protein
MLETGEGLSRTDVDGVRRQNERKPKAKHSSPHLQQTESRWGILIDLVVTSLREGASKKSASGRGSRRQSVGL